jgi:hypothetical protein
MYFIFLILCFFQSKNKNCQTRALSRFFDIYYAVEKPNGTVISFL